MEEIKLFSERNDLIETKFHKKTINIYAVTEDEVNNFSNYSLDFQILVVMFGISAGGVVSVLPSYGTNEGSKIILYTCLGLSILIFILLLLSRHKFNKTKKNLFKRADNFEAGQSNPRFKIKKATYGTPPANSIDVTDKISSMIKDNKLSFVVSNEAVANGDDPQIGTRKPLIIDYEFNDIFYSKNYLERDTVNLP